MNKYRIVLFLSEKCNKQCYYCDIGQNPKQKDIKKESFFNFFPLINMNGMKYNYENYTITGGEPGLVDVDVFDFFFKEKCKGIHTNINTNGLFIEKGYFDKFYDKIDKIGLHPYVDIDEIPKELRCDPKIIIYQPIYKNKIDKIEEFCKNHNNFLINLIPYVQKYQPLNNNDLIIPLESFQKIIDLTKNLENLELSTIQTINRLSKQSDCGIYLNRKFCGNSYNNIVFDFSYDKIWRCPTSKTNTDKDELTTEKINLCFEKKLFRSSESDLNCAHCFDCLRYFNYYFNQFLQEIKYGIQ